MAIYETKIFQKCFSQKCKNPDTKIFLFYVIAFDTFKINTGLAPQNDSQSLSFVKNNKGGGQKMTRNGHKMNLTIVTTHLGESVFTSEQVGTLVKFHYL